MAAKKSASTKTKSKGVTKNAPATTGASTFATIVDSLGSLVTSAVGSRLNDVLVDMKDRVSTMVAEDAPQVLEDAKKKVTKAVDDLFEWGKEHPLKTAAAAAALLATSAFVYATMHSHEVGAKAKSAAKKSK